MADNDTPRHGSLPPITQHASTSDLRSSLKRVVGIPETVEIVLPEGSAATDAPPVNTRAIRYWLVHDGRRLKRHRSLSALFADSQARRRLSAVLKDTGRTGLRTLAPLLAVVALLLVVGWLAALWAVTSGLSPTLLQIGLVGFSLLLLWPMAASGLRLHRVLVAEYYRHGLSHDEGTPLTLMGLLSLVVGYVVLIYLTVPLAALIVRLLSGVLR